MKQIVTITMNPALDLSASIDKVVTTHKLRCGPGVLDPGGGGVNVSRVVKRLGGSSTAIYMAGGPMGQAYRELLEAEGVEGQAIAIEDNTRLSFTADETQSGEQYRFVLEGPTLREPEWRACLDALSGIVGQDDLVVASGSLPPGAPDDFYGRIAVIAAQAGARCLVDTSGAPLRATLEQGVHFIKPNLRELRDLTGARLETPEEQQEAAMNIVRKGQSSIVALTLGADGALLASAEGTIRAPAWKVEKPRSAVGAGDSFVGAFVLALWQGRTLREAMRYASAAGAAALLTPATELCRREDVERFEREMAAAEGETASG